MRAISVRTDEGHTYGIELGQTRRRKGVEQCRVLFGPGNRRPIRWIPSRWVQGESQYKGKPYPVARALACFKNTIAAYPTIKTGLGKRYTKAMREVADFIRGND